MGRAELTGCQPAGTTQDALIKPARKCPAGASGDRKTAVLQKKMKFFSIINAEKQKRFDK